MHRTLALVATAIAAIVQSAPPSSGFDHVAAVYHERIRQAGIVGSGLAYVQDGAVAATAFEGYQDLQTKRPIDEQTIYHWASITKSFTGVAIMQLRDRGILSLDDAEVKYVQEIRAVHNLYGDMSQVTVRYLLHHSV